MLRSPAEGALLKPERWWSPRGWRWPAGEQRQRRSGERALGVGWLTGRYAAPAAAAARAAFNCVFCKVHLLYISVQPRSP